MLPTMRLVAVLACLRLAVGVKVQGFFTDPNHELVGDEHPCDGSLCGFFEGKRAVATDPNGTIHVLGIDNDNLVWAARGTLDKLLLSVPAPSDLEVDFSVKSKKVGKLAATFDEAGDIVFEDGNVWSAVAAADVPELELTTEGTIDGTEDLSGQIFNGVWQDEDSGARRFVTDRIGKRQQEGISIVGFTDPGYWGLCKFTYPGVISCKFSDGSRKNASVKAAKIIFTDGMVWTRMQVKRAPPEKEL